jgi:hypothetical protein
MINLNWQPGMTLESIEKSAILQAFRFYRGNKTVTANALGMAIRTLDNKLDQYQAEGKEQERLNNEQRKQREEFLQRQRGIYPSTPTPAGGTMLSSADAGVSVESTSEAAQKQTMSVPQRKEVQGVLSQPAAQGHTRKAR